MVFFKYYLALTIIAALTNISLAQQVLGPMPEGQERPTNIAPEELIGHGFVLAVNGDAVSSYDIIEKTRGKLAELAGRDYKGFYTAAGPIVQAETMKEIYDLLMYQYALHDIQKNDSGDQMIQAAREKQRKNIIRRYAGNQAIANIELEKMGTSMEEMLDRFQRQLVVSSYKDVSFSSDNTITRLEILDYYNNNIDKYISAKEQLQFSVIQVDSRQKAQEILTKLKAGEDFAELAKTESKDWRAKYGGLWNPVEGPDSIQKTLKPVAKILIKLQPGQLTDIIESDDKFFIARLESYSPQQYEPLAEVQDQVRKEINELRWQEYTEKLSKKLLERAVVGDVDAFVAGTVYTAWKKFGSTDSPEIAE